MELNNCCDILYSDFETAFKITLLNKSEKWIEAAYTYLLDNLEDPYFTREDIIMILMPLIH